MNSVATAARFHAPVRPSERLRVHTFEHPSTGDDPTSAKSREPGAALLRRAQAGDQEALVALVESQQTYVYSIALSVMRNPADAADMTQEAFIRLFRTLPTYRSDAGARFTTWLYRLVINICLDGLRRKGRSVASLDDVAVDDDAIPVAACMADPDRWSQPETSLEIGLTSAEVRSALAQLPQVQRTALTLLYFEDLRYDDIARIMGLPLNTVKSHIRRARERLAVIFKGLSHQPPEPEIVSRQPGQSMRETNTTTKPTSTVSGVPTLTKSANRYRPGP